MSRKAVSLTFAVLLAACNPPPTPDPAPLAPPADPAEPDWLTSTPEGCDVQVVFGSYGAGVDGALHARVLELTRTDPGIVSAVGRPWGREGESTLCIRTADGAAADRLYETVAPMIPETSTRAWSAIAHRDGRNRRTEWPAERK